MHATLSVTFLHLERLAALETRVREIGERLLRQNSRIQRCHMTVEGSKQAPGIPAAVRIHLSLPHAEIHASGGIAPEGSHGLDDALKEAYLDARRQLQELDRQRSLAALVPRHGS